jgi:uncharacterized protein (UPF0335 family)
MPTTLEELAERVSRLEGLYDGMVSDVKEMKKMFIDLYEKTERDKTDLMEKIGALRSEMIERMEMMKSDLIGRIESVRSELKGEIEALRSELIDRIESSKTSLIKWMVGTTIAYTAVVVAVIWAILSFGLK